LNKTKIYGISIPICLVFVSLLINASHGQSPVNFLNYTNNDMKFTIQHPSNWQVKENTESPDGRVSFELSDRSLPIFAVNTEQAEPHLDSDKMTLKNISLQELAEHELNEMTSSVFRNFDLIKQNKVTVGGNDGWKMEFAGEDNFYLFEICTIANGKIYILTYQDYPSKVPETLPLANKMVESFQIITE
jgi:PsbP